MDRRGYCSLVCVPLSHSTSRRRPPDAWFSSPSCRISSVLSSVRPEAETGLKIWATIAFCLAVTAAQPGIFALQCRHPRKRGVTARSASKAAAVALCIALGAATQLLPAVELIRAAQEHSVSELLPRLPWEVGNSISFERALAFDRKISIYMKSCTRSSNRSFSISLRRSE